MCVCASHAPIYLCLLARIHTHIYVQIKTDGTLAKSRQLATTTPAAQRPHQPTHPMHFLPFFCHNTPPSIFHLQCAPPPPKRHCPVGPRTSMTSLPTQSLSAPGHMATDLHMPSFNPVAGSLFVNSMAGSLLDRIQPHLTRILPPNHLIYSRWSHPKKYTACSMQHAMCNTNSLPLFPRFLPFLYVSFPFRPISFTPILAFFLPPFSSFPPLPPVRLRLQTPNRTCDRACNHTYNTCSRAHTYTYNDCTLPIGPLAQREREGGR